MSDISNYTKDLSPEQRDLFELLLKERQAQQSDRPTQTIPRRADLSSYPISTAQQRLWFLDQWDPGSPNYNLPQAIHLQGRLNTRVLERSLNEIIRRHEPLRSTFSAHAGRPVQHVASSVTIKLPIIDLRELAQAERDVEVTRLIAAEAQRPFNLVLGPMVRATLLRLGVTEHIVLLTMHHVVSDGWSNGVFVREMSALYEAFSAGKPSPLPALPIQYADFAAWQQHSLQSEVQDQQLDYWKRQLAGAPRVVALPTDKPRPSVQTFNGQTLFLMIAPEQTAALNALSHREGVTLFMTLLAIFKTLLYRYIGQDDIIVGTPIANRNRAETEALIGAFVNTLVLRTDLGGNPTFRELLSRVRAITLAAYEHQDVPFERLVDELRPERDLSHSTLFQMMFALQNAPMPVLEGRGLRITPLHTDSGTAKFDLSIDMMETDQGLMALLEYNTDLFEPETITRLWAHFETLMHSILADPDQRIGAIPLLSAAEQRQIMHDWNSSSTPVSLDCVHELIAAQAARTPDAAAVVFGDTQLTYAQLDARANHLAHQLQSLGVEPQRNQYVAICLERSLDLVVAALAVLKAGGAYVPLDPDYPPERLAYMIADIATPIVLTQHRLAQTLPDTAQLVCLDDDWPAIAAQPSTPPSSRVPREHLAYAIFTSGSTGRPKSVAITHASLANTYWAYEAAYGLRANTTRHLQMANFSFDVFTGDIIRALCSGGTLVLCPRDLLLQPQKLYAFMREQRIDCAEFVPTVLRTLSSYLVQSEQMLDFMRLLVVSSDTWYAHDHQQIVGLCGPHTRLINAYGVTEATIDSSYYDQPPRSSAAEAIVPIGRPLPNTRLYVLDRAGQLAPVGVLGELHIGGPSIARGYIGRPRLTAEKFVPDPFSGDPGARLYRSGDLVRALADGNIEFLGRIDSQVKLRGLRIELGEIEAVLATHPAVHEAIVMVHEGTADVSAEAKRIVAYVVARTGPAQADLAETEAAAPAALGSKELYSFLKQQLPDYMIPSAFVMLDSFPITPNGKLDRQALCAPEALESDLEAGFLSPRTPTEDLLSGIWTEVLERDRVGVHDNFFELGGHSLLATQAMSRVCTTFQLDLPLRSLFDAPTIAGLAASIEAARAVQQQRYTPPIMPAPRDQPLPPSFSQERLWFIDQLTPGNTAYNTPGTARIRGNLNIEALEQSFEEMVRRHEILRTTFDSIGGQPIQVIAPPDSFKLSIAIFDLSDVPVEERFEYGLRVVTQEAQLPFDLQRGPLFRVTLLQLDTDDYLLVLPTHHIVSDLMSVSVFMREMRLLYEAFAAGKPSPLPKLPVQYADFVVWQRSWLRGEVLDQQLDYWRKQLSGAATTLELPTDRPRPKVQTFSGARQYISISPQLTKRLKALCRQEGVTTFMLLISAFKTLLYRYTGQEDIIVGTPVANRNRHEIEDLIGFFVNTLVLRTDLSGNPSFRELLRREREVCLGAYANQDVPFEKLVEVVLPGRDTSRNPLFQVLFSFLHNYIVPVTTSTEATLEVIRLHGERSQFDLSLDCWEGADRLLGSFDYNTDLFDAASMQRFAAHLETLLASIVADPDQGIDHLSILSGDERDLVLRHWNRSTLSVPPEPLTLIHLLVEQQAARTPNAPALTFDGMTLSCAELNGRANQLAHYLRRLGVGPHLGSIQRVGVCLDRSLELVVGMLGILKAGGAYVPLDPAYPVERLSFMLDDSQAAVLLTQQDLIPSKGGLPYHGQILCLDTEWSLLASENTNNLEPTEMGLDGDHLAYIIYTSGSTGRPKGVQVTHRNVTRLLASTDNWFGFGPQDVWTLFHSAAFDFSVWELWGALCYGGRLVVVPYLISRSPDEFVALVRREGVTVLNQTPSAFRQFIEAEANGDASALALRYVIFGGEALAVQSLRPWFERHGDQRPQLINMYGITETTVHVTYHPIRAADLDHSRSLIGVAIPDLEVYLLDRTLEPVPIGVAGELYVSGSGLARGYLNRPALTAERFVPNPFSDAPGAQLYKSGDLGRYLPDGNIEYLGRGDQQVKLRGFRIELGEIETALLAHPDVRDAAVIIREDAPGDQRLVAYVLEGEHSSPTTAAEEHLSQPLDPSELREFLRERLPDYMVPSAFVPLDVLPLTTNGKLDRRALPAPSAQTRPGLGARFELPRNPIEQALAETWATVLGLQQVGIHDSFFELGGHSLLATQIISRLREDFDIEMPLRALFERPTIAELAASITVAQWAVGQHHAPLAEDEMAGEL